MTPAFSLQAGSQDRTAILTQRLLRIHLTENTGKEADELELEFDDAGGAIALPSHGAVLTLAIGWVGQPLVAKGSFTVDETEISGPPDRVKVKAKGSDMRGTWKAHKNRAWHVTTIGAIVGQVATDQGLTAQVHPDLAGVTIDHRDQTGESDLHFVTRLGRDHDAIASVKGGKLIFAPKGAAVSASGQSLGPLQLTRSDLVAGDGWRMGNMDRDKHGTVRGRHRDMNGASDLYVSAGAGDPVRTLRHVHASEAAATNAAHAHHRHGKRKAHKLELTLAVGDPTASAGRPLAVSGIRDGVDGRWITSKVEHEIEWEGKGFDTKIEATVDGLTEDQGDETPSYGGDDADPEQDDGGGE